MAAEEIRRSGRATKGVHTKTFDETNPPATRGRGKKAAKQASAEATPDANEENDAIIRCVCGDTEEDEDDERVMVCCDNCSAWQHNLCMGLSEEDDDLPDQYYCEQCRPGDHEELLAAMARGEQPWVERAAQKAREQKEKKSRKRKGGKRGRKSKDNVKADKTKQVDAHQASPQPAIDDALAAKVELGGKRKAPHEVAVGSPEAMEAEPSTKMRRVSVPQEAKTPRRKSMAVATPTRRETREANMQMELVQNVADLESEIRQRTAGALVKCLVEQALQAQKQGTFKAPMGQSIQDVGRRLGLEVEYANFLNYWGYASDPNPQYRDRLMTMLHNVKANPSLRDRLLKGSLAASEFSKMSSDDMASEELQQKKAEIIKEVEKQHLLVQEEGPRIRRTHKGEELVEDASHHLATTESGFSQVPRRRESNVEAPGSPRAADAHSPHQIQHTADAPEAASPTDRPLSLDTTAAREHASTPYQTPTTWAAIDVPDVDHPQPGPAGLGVQADAEIEKLLKDEEGEDEEPYSPTDHHIEPGIVWRGQVSMASIADFQSSARYVAGANLSSAYSWASLMPDVLSVEGRIDMIKATHYLCGLQWSKTTDVTVAAITPAETADDLAQFDTLFTYFTTRQRYGVLGKSSLALVRDAYLVPLEAGSGSVPEFIELLQENVLETPRPHRVLLLVYVIKTKPDAPGPLSAQSTPRAADGAVLASPIAPSTASQIPPLLPPGHQTSPTEASQSGHLGDQGGSAQHQHGFALPHGPVGIEAAKRVLGDMANSPAVAALIAQVPNTGVGQWIHIKEVFESRPESRNDIGLLMTLIQQKMNLG